MIFQNVHIIMWVMIIQMMIHITHSSNCITVPVLNYNVVHYNKVNSLKNGYLRWVLSYANQKRKQRMNIIKRYFIRNAQIKQHDMEVTQTIVHSKAINSLYELSSKYSNLSREEVEFIEFIISSIN